MPSFPGTVPLGDAAAGAAAAIPETEQGLFAAALENVGKAMIPTVPVAENRAVSLAPAQGMKPAVVDATAVPFQPEAPVASPVLPNTPSAPVLPVSAPGVSALPDQPIASPAAQPVQAPEPSAIVAPVAPPVVRAPTVAIPAETQEPSAPETEASPPEEEADIAVGETADPAPSAEADVPAEAAATPALATIAVATGRNDEEAPAPTPALTPPPQLMALAQSVVQPAGNAPESAAQTDAEGSVRAPAKVASSRRRHDALADDASAGSPSLAQGSASTKSTAAIPEPSQPVSTAPVPPADSGERTLQPSADHARADRETAIAAPRAHVATVAEATTAETGAARAAPADAGAAADAPTIDTSLSTPVFTQTLEAAASRPAALPYATADASQATVSVREGRFGADVGVAIARAAGGDGKDLLIRLDPRDMGRVDVRLSFDHDGVLRAVVSADSPAALDMLRRESPDLHRSLADAGVRSDGQSLRFDGNGAGGGSSGQARQGFQRQQHPAAGDPGQTAGPGGDTPIPYRSLAGSGHVDLMA